MGRKWKLLFGIKGTGFSGGPHYEGDKPQTLHPKPQVLNLYLGPPSQSNYNL